MNKLTLYNEDNINLSDAYDIDEFNFSQTHRSTSHENINQKIQKFQIFNPQHQATLGFIKLDGKIKYTLQITNKTIKKNKQILQDPKKCSICNKQFASPQAVGGHSSRTHPNESEKYQSKVAKREERKHELYRTRQLQAIVQSDLDFNFQGLEL